MSLIARATPSALKVVLVALPMLLALGYFVFVAADRYVSEAVVTVRQAHHEAPSLPGAALLLAGLNPPSRDDTLYLRQYIHSLDLMRRLDAELGLRAHYESEPLDPFYRLYPAASQEWFLEYYRSRVEVLFDDAASLLTVRVQAFDPAFAQRVNRAILRESEAFVNEFSQRIAREQMRFAEGELGHAAERLQAAKAAVLAFQGEHRLLDPHAQAQASGALQAELRATLAREETELHNLRSYLNDNSHQVRAARSRVDALRNQLDEERKRATTRNANEGRLNELAARFQDLKLQAGFAEDAYKLALAAVENARIDATRKVKSLVVIETPSEPQTAFYPRRAYNLLTLFVLCCLVYAIARLAIATIRDHQD